MFNDPVCGILLWQPEQVNVAARAKKGLDAIIRGPLTFPGISDKLNTDPSCSLRAIPSRTLF